MSELVSLPIGQRTEQVISQLQDEEGSPATGNVLRRVCQYAGEGACKQACHLAVETATSDVVAEALAERTCADLNLLRALKEIDLLPEDVLMVGATADNIGYVDELSNYDGLVFNPNGWRELPNFNAFFGREDEIGGIGCRMADCADINFEFEDRAGRTVLGFEHGTRTNMYGPDQYAFERGGRKMSFTKYVLLDAIEHYGVDPATIHINLMSAIKGENNEWHFDDPAKIEELLPGWRAAGFLKNVTKPGWQPGQTVDSADIWQADTRGMIINDIEKAMYELGIPSENLDKTDVLDPNESNGRHSSHKSSYLMGSLESRDLYITYFK